MRRRRKRQLAAVATGVVFVVALALWIGRSPSRGLRPGALPRLGVSTTASAPAVSLEPGSPTPTASASASAGSGVGGLALPPVSGHQYYGPGIHRVVLRVTSDNTIGIVGYLFRNGRLPGVKKYAVPKTFSVAETVNGGGPLGVIAAQVSYYATTLTCSVTIDGIVRDTVTVHGANHVAVCLA